MRSLWPYGVRRACAVGVVPLCAGVVMATCAARSAAHWVTVTVSSNIRTCCTFASRANGADRALAKFGSGVFWSSGSRVEERTGKAVTLRSLLGEKAGLSSMLANS